MAAVDEESLYRLSETLQMIHNTLQCAICLDLLRDAVSTRCGHPFCRQCLNGLVAHAKNGRAPCPLCNAPVTRRGINDNEKLRRLVQGVSGLITAVRQDTGIDIMIQSRGPRMTSREAFSPSSHDKQKRADVNRTVVATSSGIKDGNSGKVESWLMKLPPNDSLSEPESQQPAVVSCNEDTDSEEMVSVTQIIPERISPPTLPSVDEFDKLMLEYQKEERKMKTQASNNIEDDGDSRNLTSNEDEWTPKKKKDGPKLTKGRSVARKKRTPLKKKKIGSAKDSVAKLFSSKKNEKLDSPRKGGETVQVVHPIVVLKDSINEKENLAARSPGWSRVKQMKKEFHDPGKSVLKYQNAVDAEHKDSCSAPSIEEECSSSTSDDVPCLNLSLQSQHIKKKEKINEIVSTLETEIEIYERSCQSNIDCQVISNHVLTPEKAASVQVQTTIHVDTDLSPTPSSKEGKEHDLSNVVSNDINRFRTEKRQHTVTRGDTLQSVESKKKNVNRVCFVKLGKMAQNKTVVLFLRLGRLFQPIKNSPTGTLPSTPPRRCDVQVQTSPSLCESQPNTCDTQFSSPFAVPFPGIEPKRRSCRGEKKALKDDTASGIEPKRISSVNEKKKLDDDSDSGIKSIRRSSIGEKKISEDDTDSRIRPKRRSSISEKQASEDDMDSRIKPKRRSSTSEKKTSDDDRDWGIEPKRGSSRGKERKSVDSDTMMDAETIILSQPVSKISIETVLSTNTHNEQYISPSSKKSVDMHEVMTSGASVHETRHMKDAFSLKNVQDGISGKNVDIASQDSTPNGVPNVSFNNHGSRKRARASSNSGESESSDSDPGFLQTSHAKKKKKNVVLSDNSDNESNSPLDFQDMSLLEESEIIVNRINANIEAELEGVERKKSTDSAFDEPKRGFSPNWYDPVSLPEDDPLASPTPKSTISSTIGIFEETKSRRPSTPCQTPKTQGDLFEDQLDASGTVKTQIDTDSDSDLVLATPVKQTSFNKRVESQSEDIVPNSQPGDKQQKKQAINNVSNPLTSHQDISVHATNNSTASPLKDVKSLGCSTSLQGKETLGIKPLPSPACDKARDEALQVCPSKPAKIGFACSGLPNNYISQVVSLAKLVGAEFSSKFETELVTHLVVRVNADNTTDKTLKYLNAVASGKWIVSMKWVLDCVKEKKLIPEDKYEVLDSTGEPGPRRSRTSTVKLFQNFEFCCIGPFADLTKEQMEDLLLQCGATLVSEPTKFTFKHYSIILVQYNEEQEQVYSKWLEQYCAPVIQHDWVLECLGKFSVTSFWQLLVCDCSEEQLLSMGFPPNLIDSTDADSYVTTTS